MAASGPNSGSTFASDSSVGTKSWTGPSNAASSNNSYASVSGFPTLSSLSYYLKCTNFGFSIPSGATIDGIVVEIERKGTNFGSQKCYDDILKLIKGGAYVGSNKADTSTAWPSSDAYATYGGASDLWGTTWTDSDINSANFGVGLSTRMTCDGKNGVASNVDHVRITVYYTTGGGGGTSTNAVLYVGN